MINKYGIVLSKLTIDDINLVREWRNSDKIKQYARNKDYITEEMQKNWFAKLDESKNLYFVITTNNTKIGLIWANYLNADEVETGFYIYEDEYLNSIYSYKIVTTLHHYLFDTLKIKNIYCDILNDNKRAIRFNTSLGFVQISTNNTESRYQLSYNSFTNALQKIDTIITKY